MAISELIKAFEDEETLPVDLNKIAKWITGRGIQDEIEFIGVELDVEVIRGFLHRFRYSAVPYAEPTAAAHIYYGVNQPEDWVNIVCAKELIHMMDGNGIARKAECDTLIKRLTLPKELKILLEDPAYALMDKFGDAFAAAVLLPSAARRILIEAYESEDITAADIARAAVMPVRYVRMVMAPEWERAYARMLEL